MTNVKSIIFWFSLISSCSVLANTNGSGGISLGATRLIYPISAKQVSLPIINNSQKNRYLVNAWIDNENGEKTKDLLMTPPLFVSEAGTENTFRIIKVADNFPQNKESIYWVNVKTIPSVSKEVLENSNVLQLAILSRIKLFIRPNNLPYVSEDALKNIKFHGTADGIEIENLSPYFISFVNIKVDGESLPSKMAAPLEKTKLNSKKGRVISYQTVNDFGGITEITEHSLRYE